MSKPNFRNRPYKPGRMSDERVAWVKLHNSEFVRYEDTDDNGELTGVRLSIRLSTARPVLWVLQSMTMQELVAIREFLIKTLERVEPLIARLDKEAEHDLEAGDDSNARSYRAAPQVVTRKGGKYRDSEGVPQRSDDVLPVRESPGDAGGSHDPGRIPS